MSAPIKTFKEKMDDAFNKHSDSNYVALLIDHILKIIKEKKKLLQSRLLKNPNKALILLFKDELSQDSWDITKFLGFEKYPFYIQAWDKLSQKSVQLATAISEILELQEFGIDVEVRYAKSVFVPVEGNHEHYDHLVLMVKQNS